MRYETPEELRRANARAASGRESTLRNRAARETRPKPDLGAAMERLRVYFAERDAQERRCEAPETPDPTRTTRKA